MRGFLAATLAALTLCIPTADARFVLNPLVGFNARTVETCTASDYLADPGASAANRATTLLLHFDQSDNTIPDSSSRNRGNATNANITNETTQSKFGGRSGFFRVAGDANLTYPDDSGTTNDWNFQGDFLFDWWQYLPGTNTRSNQTLINHRTAGGGADSWHTQFGNGAPPGDEDSAEWHNSVALIIDALATTNDFVADTWQHVMFTRRGTTLYKFVDGVQKQSAPLSQAHNLAAAFHIGMDPQGAANLANAYIDEFRMISRASLDPALMSGFASQLPTSAYCDG